MIGDSESSWLGTEHQEPRRRQRRVQVARACDACRLRRTKCDNGVPCSKCIARGYRCSNSGAPKASTLTEASEEIASLKRKIQQLETELKRQASNHHNLPSPIGSSPSLYSAPVSTGGAPEPGLKGTVVEFSFDLHVPLTTPGSGPHPFTHSSSVLATFSILNCKKNTLSIVCILYQPAITNY